MDPYGDCRYCAEKDREIAQLRAENERLRSLATPRDNDRYQLQRQATEIAQLRARLEAAEKERDRYKDAFENFSPLFRNRGPTE
jgi:predicted RNase H-like nuclease (RuvC/YqgF family)